MNIEKSDDMPHSPLPWRITEWTEQEMASIIDANGNFITWLPSVGVENAKLIVKSVNAVNEKSSQMI